MDRRASERSTSAALSDTLTVLGRERANVREIAGNLSVDLPHSFGGGEINKVWMTDRHALDAVPEGGHVARSAMPRGSVTRIVDNGLA